MADVASNDAAPRVVLLARAGKAADHLAEAVRQARAELLAIVDPSTADEAALRALNPQAVLVALEPSIEPMLDKLEALLSDPALTVIYDEADVAAHRTGWDAARWARHLSAKLRHDSDVLPPGTESDHDWQPSPGQIPKPAAAYADVDMTSFTREALAHADSVPADGAPVDVVPGIALSPLDTTPIDAIPASPTPAAPVQAAPAQALSKQAPPTHAVPHPLPPVAPPPSGSGIAAFQTSSFETMALESMDAEPRAYAAASDDISFETFTTEDGAEIEDVSLDSSMTLDSMNLDSMTLESVELDGVQLDGMQFDGMQLDSMQLDSMQLDSVSDAAPSVAPMRLDEDAFFLEELSVTARPSTSGEPGTTNRFGADLEGGLDFSDDEISGFETLDMDSLSSADPSSRAPTLTPSDDLMSFEALIASGRTTAAQAVSAPAAPQADSKYGSSLGDLSLTPVDDAPSVVRKSAASPAAHDLSALESRISSLSLVDIDESAPETFGIQATPVVLIEAGLGGPDPARQLLSSLPAEFMAVVLVRLHLQGGRYDRLVAQMERTAALPVALAQVGATANAGTIYFLPDDIGLTANAGTFGFVYAAAPPAAMFAALPSAASALVFLSGSDPQLVDNAMAIGAAGTLVIAQSPEDCYDGAACAELRNRGVTSGLPAELAGRLASRWPS